MRKEVRASSCFSPFNMTRLDITPIFDRQPTGDFGGREPVDGRILLLVSTRQIKEMFIAALVIAHAL
jgi:hypothetical protein